MNYDDFPILSKEEYNLINFHLSKNVDFDRNYTLSKICTALSELKTSCSTVANKHNTKIKESLNLTFNKLSKLIDNITSTFSFKAQTIIKEETIFSFVNKLSNLILETHNWSKMEQKEYYSEIAHKTTCDLIEILNKITASIDSSCVMFFKHM